MASFNEIWDAGGDVEVKIEFRSTGYARTVTQDDIVSVKTTKDLFPNGKPTIGAAVAKSIELSIVDPLVDGEETIPRAAEINLWIRAVNGGDASAWVNHGLYVIDVRSRDETLPDVLNIVGYDLMLSFEVPYVTSGSVTGWPKTDIDILDDIEARFGVQVDQDSYAAVDQGYLIQFPGYGEAAYTVREILGFIAGFYGGNWIFDDYSYLTLIEVGSETGFLVDENGNYISDSTGVRIIV